MEHFEPTPTVRALAEEVMRLHRALGRFAMRNAQTSLSVLGTLQMLASYGEMRVADIAAKVGLTQSAISRQVSEMIRLGLVERRIDDADGRAVLISITAIGQARLASESENRAEQLCEMVTDWEGPQVDHVLDAVRLLADTLEPRSER
ncbi:MAG TPA: MarR family winged helix-turn-helix transcriptional regulator [Pseudonocardiaceae bacterium]